MSEPDRGLSPEIEKLLSTETIRVQAHRMFQLAQSGKTQFQVNLDRVDPCSEFVTQVIRKNYPDLKIPFHSRWGHFRAGGLNRVPDLDVRSKIDLVVVSVLLDAGAGMAWKYKDARNSQLFTKSEGLAVASLDMFLSGLFSSDPRMPHRCDSKGLRAVTLDQLKKGFQVSAENPLIGIEGRLKLLHSLGDALSHPQNKIYFRTSRIGDLFNWYEFEGDEMEALPADVILRGIQLSLGSIWPGRLAINGFNLGDVWKYPAFGNEWVPFHKLSQWLSYSLIEPLIEGGLHITDADRLTGLAEYRNGGLFLDTGVLQLRDPSQASRTHEAGSELVVEWRALTVELLEQVAENVRKNLGMTKENFPLGKVLEGGTWAAGRIAAAEKRADGGPPLQIQSDGTVF